MKKYNHQKIEKKWQKVWEESGIFRADDRSKKPKFYSLDMFPYPSGQGLHVGHPRGYTANDIIAHFMRSKGYNVLRPMGWDAFGLPAENYAIKMGVHPEISTKKNIENIKKQIQSLGLSYDWSREINTTDPDYYKWTQWIFLQLFKKGLAYEAVLPINWCPSCKTGLANEEVVNDGKCERCDSEVEKKSIRQWVLRITDYAERLLDDLELLKEWPEKIKEMQKNWIGKSEGWEIKFSIFNFQFSIPVFTTRADTLFGCTYLVVAPEHPIINDIKDQITNYKHVKEYVEKSKKKSERERISETKEKTGVELKGVKAVNPVNGREIPIFAADYVLFHYGTGAVMAVPAHDQRDFDFAKQHNLAIIDVIKPLKNQILKEANGAYEGSGIMTNSKRFDGMKSERAKEKIGEWLVQENKAKKSVYYKLRDWIFSRQRYWGEPIPIIRCPKCGAIPLKEKDLPLKLPKVKKYKPTGTGESPLAAIEEWVNVECPKCGGEAKRETNTMPQWAGSCWYYLRYLDPQNEKKIFSKKKEKHWMPIDLYVGGVEHAVLHLLYARFWHKFLYDIGLVSTKEPFYKLRNQGLILAQDGQKMSKSKGNVVNPNEIIEKYGADTLRLYEMFIGPFEEPAIWNTGGIKGISRFLHKVWKLEMKVEKKIDNKKSKNAEFKKIIGQTVKKVTEDIENFKFNTAISSLMVLTNGMEKQEWLARKDYGALLKLLSPFAPHLTEELYQKIGKKESIHSQSWPKYDEKSLKEKEIVLIIQVNGKFRDKMAVESSVSEEKAKNLALSREKIDKWVEGKKIKKIIFIPKKLINIVI